MIAGTVGRLLVICSLVGLGILVGQGLPVAPAQHPPARPRLFALARIEIEAENGPDQPRYVNFVTGDGERFTIIGRGEVIEWLITQQSGATIAVTLVNP